jgi:O-antigen ligase
MGAMFIIIGILFYKSGFGVSPFNFKIRKHIVLMLLLPAILVIGGLQFQNITSGNLDSYKSSIHRITISIRSYEIFQEVFPTGGGPGSQTFLMNEQRINADFLEDAGEDALLTGALVKEVEGFQSKVGSGQTASPHNTYVDFLVPFGAMGLFFVFCILFVQLGSAKRILFDKRNQTAILDSFAVSAMFFFLFSSLFNLWWLYLIYYRMLISRKID